MPLSWNEIKDRALRFSREWQDESLEDAEANSFRDGFFDVFGGSRRRVANFAAEKADARKPPKLTTDAARVAFLFKRYQHLTSLLPAAKPSRPRRRTIEGTR